MTHEEFFSKKKTLENSIITKKVTTSGFPINWLKMSWIKLERSKSHLIQLRYDYNEDSEFNTINIGKSETSRSHILKNMDQPLSYPKSKTATKEKWRDIMDLLKFISPVIHDFHKT